jgi:hypothetical protein
MVQRQLDFCHSVSRAERSEQESPKYPVYYCATFFHGHGLNSHCNDFGRVLPLNNGVHHTSSLHTASSFSRPSAKTTRKQHYCPTFTLSHTSSQPVCHLVVKGRGGDLLIQSSQLLTSIAYFSFSLLLSLCPSLRIRVNSHICHGFFSGESTETAVDLGDPAWAVVLLFVSLVPLPGCVDSLCQTVVHLYHDFNPPIHILSISKIKYRHLFLGFSQLGSHSSHAEMAFTAARVRKRDRLSPSSCPECPAILLVTFSGLVMR